MMRRESSLPYQALPSVQLFRCGPFSQVGWFPTGRIHNANLRSRIWNNSQTFLVRSSECNNKIIPHYSWRGSQTLSHHSQSWCAMRSPSKAAALLSFHWPPTAQNRPSGPTKIAARAADTQWTARNHDFCVETGWWLSHLKNSSASGGASSPLIVAMNTWNKIMSHLLVIFASFPVGIKILK